ncbi:hypothetical protein Plec18170_003315 [Paecilomyces lecythidis]
MSGVAKTTGLRVRFGDWDAPRTRNATKEMTKALSVGSSKSKTSDKSKYRGLQPDFLILGPASENPAAGKGKPPFKQHPFEQHVKEAMDGSNYIWKMLERPARYMRVFNLKFSFITNYTYTIFLKQEFVRGRVA